MVPYMLKIQGSVSSDSGHTNTHVAFSFSLTSTIILENISIRKDRKDVKCRITTALPTVLSPGDLTFFRCSSCFYYIFFKGRVCKYFFLTTVASNWFSIPVQWQIVPGWRGPEQMFCPLQYAHFLRKEMILGNNSNKEVRAHTFLI